mmetsp:Transcript_38983/g.94350  ORF Transcript_38983/g.94350 Transcript_38983/m.94350 type:complete len:411 (-) Transcript_38983:1185-2417(-)
MLSNKGLPPKETMKLPPVVERIEKQTLENPSPICMLVVGMAGSGKTTLIEALQQSTIPDNDDDNENDDDNDNDDGNVDTKGQNNSTDEDDKKKKTSSPPAYCINLDPACLDVPYSPSIDIRDTVDYKQVMSQHKLGPNGAILTSLNLYATKFDQVIHILESRADADAANANASAASDAATDSSRNTDSSSNTNSNDGGGGETVSQYKKQLSDYLIVDTPGQIEAFTWSASGQIISESLASTFPTVLVFVVDTVRCASSPNTFMSNMLYACSMYYRSRLPLVIVFNKTDVVSSEFCLEWMKDFEAFQDALDNARNDGDGGESGFYDSLTRSLSLVLDEFYQEFSKNAVGVSAIIGDGIDKFWDVVKQAANTDFQEYIEDLKHRIQEQEAKKVAIARAQARRLQRDVDEDKK